MSRSPRRQSSKPLVRVLVGVLLLGVLIWFGWESRSSAPNATKADEPVPTLPWAVIPPAPIARIQAAHQPDRSRVGLWMLEDPKLPVVVADSRIGWRFPRGSIPLDRSMTDVLAPNSRHESRSPVHHKDGTDNTELRVLFTGDKFTLMGDDPVYASFEVFRGASDE